MTEALLTRQILHALRALPRAWAVKIHGSAYQDAGTPDILGCYAGRMFALEVKTPRGRVTPIQARTLARWEQTGAVAAVVRSVAGALEAIGAARKGHQEARS